MKFHERRVDDVCIIELDGKLTLGAGDVQLRQLVGDMLERGEKKIVLDLGRVSYMDSAGTGELVSCFTSSNNRGAKLKLMNLSSKVRDLLQFTQLITVFEDYPNAEEAVASFNE